MKRKKKITKKKSKYEIKHPKNLIKQKRKRFLSKLSIILFLIISVIFLFIKDKIKIPLEQYQASIFPEILSFENNVDLSQDLFDEFRKVNSENKLLYNTKFKKSDNPDITVVMTLYNQAHCIHKGLRSVQNQSIKNIEIIIVDDCSFDNSTDVIKEFQKDDPRIILISHESNKGEMKSRTDGIRKAKGKYITILYGDDAFIHKDILKNSLFIINKAKLDVVEFNWALYRRGILRYVNHYYFTNITNIIYQPELRQKFIFTPGRIHSKLRNRIIWGKLIKNELLQKVLNDLGTKYTDDYNNDNEDTIIAINLFRLAKSYYIMKEVGYYYSNDEKRHRFPPKGNILCKNNNKIKRFGLYKFFKFMIEKYSSDNTEKNLIINEMRSIDHNRFFKKDLEKTHYEIMFNVYDNILTWKSLNKRQKEYIIKLRNKAIDKRNNDNK